MNYEETPDGQKYLTGSMGEVHADCFKNQKDDSKRFMCVIKQGQCEHEATCFIKLQRAIKKLFDENPKVIGAKLVWSTDKKRYLSKIPAKTMIHSAFEVADDKYSPLEP